MRKKTMYDILIQAVCIFCALLILFPILYAASVSFMEQKDVLSSPPNLLPPKPTLENYKTAFSRTMLLRYMLNSFIHLQRGQNGDGHHGCLCLLIL